MEQKEKEILQRAANTIRGLSMDAVQKANSGHPGLPMGCAELGAYLWAKELCYNPKNSQWMGRDRFVLSAGHGSMWLYSLLHLSGYKVSLDDLKRFRQLHSNTPGHPEYGDTDGVETTTGPLGQGIANAVGLALGFKLMQAHIGVDEKELFNQKVFCLAGDGCIMEGISSESSSFAAHLGLDNLILIYDANDICLDGDLKECCSEDTMSRYKAYGFDTYTLDGYDFEAMDQLFKNIRKNQTKPVFIRMHTVIGKGAPNKEGSHKAHGSPLGFDEVALAKKRLALSEENFHVPSDVAAFFEKKRGVLAKLEKDWNKKFALWSSQNPELAKKLQQMEEKPLPNDLEERLGEIKIKTPIATRSASNVVLNEIGNHLPWLFGGSADLSSSDKTMMTALGVVKPGDFSGRNIKYGVREFAMAAISSGLALTDLITPFCGTFLTFSDYMRNAVRLASLMKLRVIYQFTHDSIFLGEDGPTHQPVEHCMTLRAIPNLHVIRPADDYETKMAWLSALSYQGPTAIILSRQNLPNLEGCNIPFKEGMARGAYIVKKEKGRAAFTILATGSELSLALDVAEELEKKGKSVRVVSMPCWEIFDQQSDAYKQEVLGEEPGKMVSIEAGISLGWHKYIGSKGIAIAVESFGLSAPAADLAEKFGFSVNKILENLL